MLKRLFFFVFVLLFSSLPSFSTEEVDLDYNTSFLEKLSNIYYGKVENKDEISPVVRLFTKDGLEFEKSPISSVKMSFLFDNTMTYEKVEGSSPYFKNKIPVVEPMITVKFKDNKTKFMFDYLLVRRLEGYHNGFSEKISNFYISHDFTPNQKILIGQGSRIPINYDGSRSTMQMETVRKSQAGRTFADVFSTGIRNIATYKYLDYDIGLYDSTRYMKDFGRGCDFTSFALLKPFAGLEAEAFKNLKLGGGYSIGKNNINYHTYSVFAQYDYKKFHFKAEYANADGYNGIKTSQNKADGFYTLASYEIAPKLELLAKYDYFTPNITKNNAYSQEYTAGMTYKLLKNMKLMLNYVYRANSQGRDSNMILFATRFIL